MLSKTDNKELSDSSSTSPTLLACCSQETNLISVIDLETKQNYVTFDGAQISDKKPSWTHVKEIPNTKLLLSLHHNYDKSARMEIFDISKKGKVNKIYSLGEVSAFVGDGDVSYNSRRGILGAIPVAKRIAYHLFTIDTGASNAGDIVKLNRKTKWSPCHSPQYDNVVTGFDFNPAGESIAVIDRCGVCLVSDVDTNNHVSDLKVSGYGCEDRSARCRWSTNTGEPLLFVKCDDKILNILDVEKKKLIFKKQIQIDSDWTTWIDVCQNNGNLLASGGNDRIINIFDKRESKIVKTFEDVHSNKISCVRWNPSGDMIASASWDETTKVLDFKTGKVLHTGTTSDQKFAYSVCFI